MSRGRDSRRLKPAGGRNWPQSVAFGGFLTLAILFGGASASGFTGNAVIQIAAIIAIVVSLIAVDATPAKEERSLLLLAGLLAALFAIQLIPLPPGLWRALPGRHVIADGLAALRIAPPWMPLSLAPARTLASGLALLVPVAAFLLATRLPRDVARAAVLATLGCSLVAMMIGVAQVAGQGRLYFYVNTNLGSAVGFFANANHFATLMCVSMPLVAGTVARAGELRSTASEDRRVSRIAGLGVLLGTILLALLGITMSGSVAGVMLALLALAGSGIIVMPGLSRAVWLRFVAGVALVVVAAIVVAIVNADSDLLSVQLGEAGLSRPAMWRGTVTAIGQFNWAGSGFGSFQQVYHLFENPELVGPQFANHAHDDVLEFVLEGGLPGALLLLGFAFWFVRRFVSIWRGRRYADPIAQAGSIAALIILLHSLVDYPLRTAAIGAVFGLCLGLMMRTGRNTQAAPAAELDNARHLSA